MSAACLEKNTMKTYIHKKSIRDFNKKALLGALLAAGMVMGSSVAEAAVTTDTLNVTATLSSSCTITAGTLAFGSYIGAQLDATSTTTIICTNLLPWSIAAATRDAGSGWELNSAGATGVHYDLFTTAGRTIQLEDGTVGDPLTGIGSGVSQDAFLFGRMAANQTFTIANAGAATDTVVLTVTY